MPDYAFIYPLPYALYEQSSIRRYGFHGTSHAYVAKEAAKMMEKELNTLNLITLHLGNGASATAIELGKSIDTSMGFTPLEGLMMGTRSGDIDPAIVPFLEHNLGMGIDAIDKMLNKESGLQGICGSNDMREIISQAKKDDALSALALKMFTYRIKKYIGAYFAVLGHVDAIVFTGGIGVHAKEVREMVCEGLEASIGLKINSVQNYSESKENRPIHEQESSIKLFIIQTNEELEIALQCEQYLEGKKSLQ